MDASSHNSSIVVDLKRNISHRASGATAVVGLLLFVQAGLLAYSATTHSPTYLEPAFLVSGLANWEFGRFEPYRVNPPLVRMTAALPLLMIGYRADWSAFSDEPGDRSEFPLGDAFIQENGKNTIRLICYARWACIPFSLLGAFFVYRWAKDLYGIAAAFMAMTLYIFEPNLLAHGELITPDAACTSLGILAGYCFWRWLKNPTWTLAAFAGGSLGMAELSKMSWLILFALWPILWSIWLYLEPKRDRRSASQDSLIDDNNIEIASSIPGRVQADVMRGSWSDASTQLSQLIFILALGALVINCGYNFDETGTRLEKFRFVSCMLTGLDEPGLPGNRFRGCLIGRFPIPLPKQFVLGIDNQKKDFEAFGHRSYLRGEWRERGWWYYYFYGLFVKVPCGLWGLFAFIISFRLLSRDRLVPLRDELVLLAPAIAVLLLVSSQTGFSIHLRYVFPSLGLILIFLGQGGVFLTKAFPFRASVVGAMVVYAIVSCMLVYPKHLAYFNDFVGGPQNGHKHLLGSSLDWGQDDHKSIAWIKEHEPSSSIEFCLFSLSLADVLWDGDPVEGNTSKGKEKLILYSADYFSERDVYPHSKQDHTVEEFVKRFDSGSVLIRVLVR